MLKSHMFSKVADALEKYGFKPFVRTNDQEILIRDDKNVLWRVTVVKVENA